MKYLKKFNESNSNFIQQDIKEIFLEFIDDGYQVEVSLYEDDSTTIHAKNTLSIKNFNACIEIYNNSINQNGGFIDFKSIKNKLIFSIEIMEGYNYAFKCASYTYIDENDDSYVREINLNELLKLENIINCDGFDLYFT